MILLVSKDIIQNWNVPECLKDKKVIFKFNSDDFSSELKNNILTQNLSCYSESSKFCLYDVENNKVILTMDFIIFGKPILGINRPKRIELTCFCVNDSEMRDKGIAKYYLRKLIEFGISNNINIFEIYPNPDDSIFDKIDKSNTLDKKALNTFYIETFKHFGFVVEIESNGIDNQQNRLFFKK